MFLRPGPRPALSEFLQQAEVRASVATANYDAEAQFHRAVELLKGSQTPGIVRSAAHHLQLASDYGHGRASVLLGQLVKDSNALAPSAERYVVLLQRASQQGQAKAQVEL